MMAVIPYFFDGLLGGGIPLLLHSCSVSGGGVAPLRRLCLGASE